MPPSAVLSLPSNVIIAPPRSGTYLPYVPLATAMPAPGNHPASSSPATKSVEINPPIPPIIYFPPPPVSPLPPVCIVGCGVLDCAILGVMASAVFSAATEAAESASAVADVLQANADRAAVLVRDCAVSGGGGGSYPPPPGPPPGPLPPTDDDHYEPPPVSCDLIDTPVTLPPGAGDADVGSGPGEADGSPHNPTSPSGPSSTGKPTGSSTSAPPPPPTSSGGSQGENQGSCYFDSTDARALPSQASVNGGVTIEGCKAACSAQGLKFAGVEYGVECWCGNSISNGQTSANPTTVICHALAIVPRSAVLVIVSIYTRSLVSQGQRQLLLQPTQRLQQHAPSALRRLAMPTTVQGSTAKTEAKHSALAGTSAAANAHQQPIPAGHHRAAIRMAATASGMVREWQDAQALTMVASARPPTSAEPPRAAT
ncbi:glyoxal oxidase [Trichoderma arundinaceum]|uniref:Glyoxal oxidase n=1 Tax=Trichoderma arundinaceum TaxID=490622 RepID=A0A395NUP6_TRIAR|nr:glyoxal oxidase [Trichoderma arundinaceum]